jgi:hypothetical protein
MVTKEGWLSLVGDPIDKERVFNEKEAFHNIVEHEQVCSLPIFQWEGKKLRSNFASYLTSQSLNTLMNFYFDFKFKHNKDRIDRLLFCVTSKSKFTA